MVLYLPGYLQFHSTILTDPKNEASSFFNSFQIFVALTPMFIPSNSYQLKDLESNIFEKIHTHEFKVSRLGYTEGRLVYSSRAEVYAYCSRGYKKICEMDSDVTSLTTYNGLICIGSASGCLRVIGDFKNTLRKYYEHTAAINTISIAPDNTVVTGSDDGTLRLYRLSDDKSYHIIRYEGKYLRSIAIYCEKMAVATDALDMYDLKTFQKIYTRKFSSPISHVCLYDEDTAVISIKTRIYIVNTRSDTLSEVIAHYRNVMDVALYNNVIYSLGEDGYLKTFTRELRLLNDFKFMKSPVAFTISEGALRIALCDYSILGIPEEKTKCSKAFMLRKLKPLEKEVSYELLDHSKKRLTEYDKMLRNYEYKKCLITALASKDISRIYSVMKYLQDNRALKQTILDGDIDYIENVMEFCAKNLAIQEFTPIIAEILVITTAIHGDMILRNERLSELLEMLSERLNEEVAFQEILLRVISFLDSFPTSLPNCSP